MTHRELPSDPNFARRVEQCEVDAWLDLDQTTPGARALEFQVIDGATLMLDRSKDWPHSRVLNLGVIKPATLQTIESIVAKSNEAGITTLMSEVSPIARPGTISRLLTRAGFKQTDRTVIVARSTSGMAEPDEYFRIRRCDADDAQEIVALMNEVMPGAPDWTLLLAGQMKRPQWRYYIAVEDGVACGLAGIHLHSDIAWLSPIWVKTPYRNRGTQAALIAHCVREAEAEGAQWIVSSYPASPGGRTRNFERAGFSIVYLRNHFAWSASDN